MSRTKKVKPVFKLWFEIGDKYVLGEGTYHLMEQIKDKKSIMAAAKATNMSYRHAWDLIKDVERHLGEPIIMTHRGGRDGGRSELTEIGLQLLISYKGLRRRMADVCRLE